MCQVSQTVLDNAKSIARLALDRGEPARYTYPVAAGRSHLYFSADADKVGGTRSFTVRDVTFYIGRRR
jgi:hypothetical protein